MNCIKGAVLVGLATLAVSLAGCQTTSQGPLSPSASPGDAGAAADGSTLKVTAPTPISPASGETVQTLRPTLTVGNATGRHRTVASNLQFELSNASGVIYTSSPIAPGSSQTPHTLPSDLTYATDYRFRARGVLTDGAQAFVGPWSAYVVFRSPNAPPPPPPPPGPSVPFGPCKSTNCFDVTKVPNYNPVTTDMANRFRADFLQSQTTAWVRRVAWEIYQRDRSFGLSLRPDGSARSGGLLYRLADGNLLDVDIIGGEGGPNPIAQWLVHPEILAPSIGHGFGIPSPPPGSAATSNVVPNLLEFGNRVAREN